MNEERLKQTRHSPLPDLTAILRVWSFLWRGAVGGILGLFILIVYLFFLDTYRLNGLETIALIAAANALVIGALIFLLSRVLKRNLGIVLRIIAGILFSLCSMGFVSYLAGGFYGDVRWFIKNVILLSVTLGVPAGFMARGKFSKTK